jgi:hypothetical protein
MLTMFFKLGLQNTRTYNNVARWRLQILGPLAGITVACKIELHPS